MVSISSTFEKKFYDIEKFLLACPMEGGLMEVVVVEDKKFVKSDVLLNDFCIVLLGRLNEEIAAWAFIRFLWKWVVIQKL